MTGLAYRTGSGAVGYRPPDDLQGLVDDLVRGFVWPAEVPDPDALVSRPLLAQLAVHLRRGSGTVAQGAPVKGKAAAAPAPWNGAVAHLLDEVRRGSIALNGEVRQSLGRQSLGVPWRVMTPAGSRVVYVPASAADDVASRHALVDLVVLVAALPVGHQLESVAYRRVRGWHASARSLLGYDSVWPRVTQVRLEGEDRWVPARCPYCGSSSLRQDPASGVVMCLRPSCRDEHGRRHEWAPEHMHLLGRILEEQQ